MIDRMKRSVLLIVIGIIILLVFCITIFYITEETALVDLPRGYYVANDGDDSNDGLSPGTPWKTIEKVNSELTGCINVGDDIYFKRGDNFHGDTLVLGVGGNSSDPMIIGAYGSGVKPILGDSGSSGISLGKANTGYYTIQNLEVKDCQTQGISFNQVDISNVTISHVDVHNCGSNGIMLYKIHTYKVENCDISDVNQVGIAIEGSVTSKITNGIIWNCTSHNAGRDGIHIHQDEGGNDVGPCHWIKNCTCWECGEDSFDIVSGSDILVEDCEGYNSSHGNLYVGHGVSNVTIDNFYSHDTNLNGMGLLYCNNVILRNSVIYNWTGNGNGLVIYGNNPSELSKNLAIYNNEIISSGSPDMFQINNKYTDNVTIKNNIITSTSSSEPGIFLHFSGNANVSNINSNWSHNMWWRGDGGDGDNTWWYEDDPRTQLNWTEWNSKFEVYNNMRTDPKLVDPENGDYTLQSNSPAIDAGGSLTVTTSPGGGTQITVANAGYFCDGYGMTDGDVIKIGTNPTVMITDVDYSSNIVTVNQPITWNEGDPVNIPYSGSALDIGAYEFISVGSDIIPSKLEVGEVHYFGFFCLVLFCFAIMTKKVYISERKD